MASDTFEDQYAQIIQRNESDAAIAEMDALVARFKAEKEAQAGKPAASTAEESTDVRDFQPGSLMEGLTSTFDKIFAAQAEAQIATAGVADVTLEKVGEVTGPLAEKLPEGFGKLSGAQAEASVATAEAAGQVVGAVADPKFGLDILGRVPAGIATEPTRDIIQTTSDLVQWFKEVNPKIDLHTGALSYNPRDPDAIVKANENVLQMIADSIPVVPEPRSPAGQALRALGEFAAPYLLLSAAFGPVVSATGLEGASAALVRGSLSSTATSLLLQADGNLSNMIQGTPLANPVNEFMAVQEDDPEVTKRLKIAAEDLLGAAATEIFTRTLKVARSWNRARLKAKMATDVTGEASEKALQVELEETIGTITLQEWATALDVEVEDLKGPLVQKREAGARAIARMEAAEGRVPKDLTPAQLEERATETAEFISARRSSKKGERIKGDEGKLFYNFNRIEGPEDIEKMIALAQGLDPKALLKAKGVPTTLAATRAAADSAPKLSLRKILGLKGGDPLSGVESVQLRDMLQASTQNLLVLRRAAETGGDINQLAFRKMIVVHQSLLEAVHNAAANASRALGAFRVTAKGDLERKLQVDAILENWGGAALSKRMATRLGKLADDPRKFQKGLEKSWQGKTSAVLREIGTLGLLWSPVTHITNVVSTGAALVSQPIERSLAARGRFSLGVPVGEGPVIGEASAMVAGMAGAFRSAFTASWRRARTGESAFGALSGSKIDGMRPAFSTEAFEMSSETGLGKAVNFIGQIHAAPGTMLGAEDEWMKTIGYSMEVHALAARESTQMAIAEGLTKAQRKARYADIVSNPPEHIRVAAIDAASYATFTRISKSQTANLVRSINKLPGIGFLVVPFVNTPVNLFGYGLERAGPLAALSKGFWKDIQAGGTRRTMAVTRAAASSAVMMTMFDLSDQWHITGQGPKRGTPERTALEDAGWRANSLYIKNDGGKDGFLDLQRMDQHSTMLSVVAELSELKRNYELDEGDLDEVNEILAGLGTGIAFAVTNRTWMIGTSDALRAVTEQKGVEWWIQQRAKQMIPVSSLLRAGDREVDPTIPDVNSLLDAVQSLIPVLQARLPRKRNAHGFLQLQDPRDAPWYNPVNPFKITPVRGEIIDEELVRLGTGIGKIPKRGRFSPPFPSTTSIEFDFRDHPDAYEEYVILSGHGVQDPATGLVLVDALNEMVLGGGVQGPMYEASNDDEKKTRIGNMVEAYRKRAREVLWNDPNFAAFREDVEEQQISETLRSEDVSRGIFSR